MTKREKEREISFREGGMKSIEVEMKELGMSSQAHNRQLGHTRQVVAYITTGRQRRSLHAPRFPISCRCLYPRDRSRWGVTFTVEAAVSAIEVVRPLLVLSHAEVD